MCIEELQEIKSISKPQTAKAQKEMLPLMTQEKQRHLLNLIPNEYHADASQELINIIEHSHINTHDDIQDLELLRATRNEKSISFDEYLKNAN